MLRAARTALFAAVPSELVFVVLLVARVPLPGPLLVAVDAATIAVLILVITAGYRLFRTQRRGGADRPTALRASYEQLVPVQVRRIMGFDVKGMVSLALWLARRRHGVPAGATAVPYSRAQTPTMMVFLVAMVVELVCVEIVLRATHAPTALRTALLVLDGYTVLIALAVIAAGITRPHVVSTNEVRIRYGAFFDLRVPRHLVTEVRRVRNYNETGRISTGDGWLAVAVAAQTNLLLELTEPVTAVRPLGRHTTARTIRLFADNPDAAIKALRGSTASQVHRAATTEIADHTGHVDQQ